MRARLGIAAIALLTLGASAGVAAARLTAGPEPVVVRRAFGAAVVEVLPSACGMPGARVVRFRTAVERGLGRGAPSRAAFARAVVAILCDARGWTRGGGVRFRHDPRAPVAIELRSAATTRERCLRLTGLDVLGRYSCASRARGVVVLNADRWLGGSPWWPGSVGRYRRLLTNHEVGHLLGLGHAGCAVRGAPAPVMMQQSKGTAGCDPNPWPLAWEVRAAG